MIRYNKLSNNLQTSVIKAKKHIDKLKIDIFDLISKNPSGLGCTEAENIYNHFIKKSLTNEDKIKIFDEISETIEWYYFNFTDKE